MPNLNMYDPTQTSNLHPGANAFDAPGRGPLKTSIDPGEQANARNPHPGVRADAIDPGIEDGDRGDPEDEADEEDLEVEDDDDIDETDEGLIAENGFKKIR